MFEAIYDIGIEIIIILSILFVAQVVFLEPKWTKLQYKCNVVSVLILIISEIYFESDAKYFILFAIAGINLFIARKKHRLRGALLIVPIFGIILGVFQPVLLVPILLFGADIDGGVFYWISDVIFALILGVTILFWKKKASKCNFLQKERHLQKWESRLLICIGLVMYVIVTPVLEDGFILKFDFSMRIYFMVIIFAAMIMTLVVIGIIIQGNRSNYFESLADINEHYLNAEVKQFEEYQKKQVETRRIKHDMKNHMHTLMYLAEKNEIGELKSYIATMVSQVDGIDEEIYTGNELVNAICNSKNAEALANNIKISVDGKLNSTLNILPIDLCTIFSNALDNAIEALKQYNSINRWIEIKIKNKGNIIWIEFTNPVLKEVTNIETTKKDKINHGFGLQNIELSVKKYDGVMMINTKKIDDDFVFVLEVMLNN